MNFKKQGPEQAWVEAFSSDSDTPSPTALTQMVPEELLGDVVAAITESPLEASIDAANGLRHHGGRRPVEADFEGILNPEDGDTGI